MELYDGSLDVCKITNRWYNDVKDKNCGALITFTGIVREEGGISALSFDVYEPILKKWFNAWEQRAAEQGAFVLFAHSKGDVAVHTSSYIAGVVSPQRKVALRLINEFVEDFKANAPIWKYDVIDGERIYAKDRSQAINGAGLLA
ncbi:molybdenum cofactor biosynthesis protein MoaE [Campylobacter sp. RM9344]|uniref:Molybdopterin synthase catalytic subunit n=1 Tax=Campylobacter californiensis TaxID=1032243 RepID=A0AAW3ZTM6_9BACT|nr:MULTISPECIES: molybdenum cofactor biosynthesis protein MoaE [unclassified Campylobacter]MBE2984107.1 molybdenum cofactor biosynthesis protein MoaE [Campylobacter sp. RM6883]MBE2986268.1 molybdenum cofactor biosynthesis protein MoaE [Campylobacter sp. RM12919]MBE2988425.1 molybdenum cofactor biosynthesis protein MoaE [Campylobacter sp. RM12920]MBE2995769.1 molybdenum cofactor biosynthesis protein MoaE [Campylobacter sp. RM6913]MBE3021925.1 molybdenum cofactor biosynthesis protein MoaE [Campy